jgi:HK97 family phage major capsid protein
MAPTVAVPQTADELREQLTDKQIMRNLLSDPEAFAEHMEASVNARLKADPAILDQVKEQTENFMVEWLRKNQDVGGQELDASIARRLNLADPNTRNRIAPNTIYNKAAVGAQYDKHFQSTARFLHAISEHAYKGSDGDMSRKLGELSNAMSSIKPSDGGFLIPEILRAELLRVSLESAIVRSRARVIPMDSLTVPFPTVDSTSNVSSVFGGVVGYWTEEGATLTASNPRFGRMELRAQKLTLYTEVPNELIRDALPSLEAFIGEVFPEALAWFEDVGFFVGRGTGEPLGFLNAPAAISITRTASGQSVDWPDIANIYSQMLPQSLNRAVWIVSPDTVANLLTMPFAVGGTTTPMLLGGAIASTGNEAMPMTILGRPVVVSEKASAVGTSGDISFNDFGFYLVGDRQAMSARQSEDFRFNQDVTAFRVTERVDGRPWLASAITPYNGSANKLSPFVKLA